MANFLYWQSQFASRDMRLKFGGQEFKDFSSKLIWEKGSVVVGEPCFPSKDYIFYISLSV